MNLVDPFDALHISLKEYLGNSKYSDLIIRCESQEFKVHKVVLCGQSEYFSKVCDGDWKETTEGVIELKEDDVRVLRAMLNFLYGFDYNSSGNDQGQVSPMFFNVKVYAIADKYNVLALKARAKEKFEEAARTCWNMDEFAHVITEIYTSTLPSDRGLRDVVVETAQEHIKALLAKSDFQSALEETPGFAADVVQLMTKKSQGVRSTAKKYRCPSCSNVWEAVLLPGNGYYCIRCNNHRSNWDSYIQK